MHSVHASVVAIKLLIIITVVRGGVEQIDQKYARVTKRWTY